MPRRNVSCQLATGLGIAVAALAGAHAGDHEDALRLLVKAFDRISPRNVTAVMQMSLDKPGKKQTVRVQIAKDGRQRVEVLEPIQQAGIIIVEIDDIRYLYNPDTETLTIGRSMSADLFKPSDRLKLVRRNYTLAIVRDVELANRRVVRVDATSRYPDVGGASIFIDPASSFVMRVDSLPSPGHRVKRFETTAVSYPATMPDSTFDLGISKITKHESEPFIVRSVAEAARKAGFRPLGPRVLPYGFVIRKIYYKADSRYTTIGFDLSDGLAAATVFEFDLRQSPADVRKGITEDMRSHPDDYLRFGDTVVGIVSDLGPKARARLLHSFAPSGHTLMNEAEKPFNGRTPLTFVLAFGTNPGLGRVTPYRSLWRTRPHIG